VRRTVTERWLPGQGRRQATPGSSGRRGRR
jgi:hypothetical protein